MPSKTPKTKTTPSNKPAAKTASKAPAAKKSTGGTVAKQGLALQAITAQSIPEPPADFVSTDIKVKRATLRFIPKDLKAEALRAFDEVAARGAATFKQELPGANDPSQLGELAEQIKENDRAVQAAEALLDYLRERGQFLESDALKMLDDVAEEVEHVSRKKPAVAKAYPQTLAYYKATGEKISRGLARSGQSKEEGTG
jgi:hypothetical protein